MAETRGGPPEALHRALAAFQTGDPKAALRLIQSVLAENPDSIDALHLLGLIEARRGRLNEAERAISRAVALNPRFAAAQMSLGQVLAEQGRLEDALASLDRALALKPGHEAAELRRAGLLRRLNRLPEALEGFDRVLAANPGNAEAWNNRGVVLKSLGRFEEALSSYDRALAERPGFAAAAGNKGNLLAELNHWEEALAWFDRALALAPGDAQALNNRGNALLALGRPDEALASYERALAANPDIPYTRGAVLHLQMRRCDWRGFREEAEAVAQAVNAGKRAIYPFPFLAVSGSAAEQLACCRILAADKCPSTPPRPRAASKPGGRIRLAYLSSDFHDHATAYLMAGVFERHDRNRFETTALSFGPDHPGPMRPRLKAAFDRFVDVGNRSDGEVVGLMRALGVDIAVDLMGFTRDFRSGLLAERPAPVQVNYLGYPGTMGAGFIDYILADRFTVPERHGGDYAEKPVYLPDCYQANDDKRPRVDRPPARAEVGLPEAGFTFCAFSNSYKITPALFGLWLRLLAKTPGSVLWLLADAPVVRGNLEREAAARGIAPGRLVFAPRLDYAAYLRRYAAADLFLDTLPFNAGATASDALWAGLPVLTCPGEAFASRMAGSLLTALDLPELIAGSLEEYEAKALNLAQNPDKLAGVKAALARNRTTRPLFDTARFTRNLEAAYEAMWQRHCQGLPPASIAVPGPETRP
jgi:predicted O-linked N-acetylglucosamine transferase (SPINDLY family)